MMTMVIVVVVVDVDDGVFSDTNSRKNGELG